MLSIFKYLYLLKDPFVVNKSSLVCSLLVVLYDRTCTHQNSEFECIQRDIIKGVNVKMEKFNITTPIYYINGEPHIGHAYTSIAADILARFKRFDGFAVHFCTGTDEHGIKVARSAKHDGIEVEAFSDMMSKKFRDMSDAINMSYDDFVRTTEPRHIECAQALWRMLKRRCLQKRLFWMVFGSRRRVCSRSRFR